MSGSLLWLLLTTKHVLLAHVVDFGYSQARSTKSRWWLLGLLGWLLAELSISTVLLLEVFEAHPVCILGMEVVVLTVACLVERRAPITRLLKAHVVCELSVLVVYALIAWCAFR